MLNKFSRRHLIATPKSSKKAYEMHDGMPIWMHLISNGEEHKTRIRGIDFGKLAEMIGRRELRNLIKFENLLDKVFQGIISISIHQKTKKSRRSLEYGDYCLEISYKKDGGYGKKILIVEIKHGKTEISQQQIHRYSNYIINPSAYFRKADEVKVIFMIFTEIDTLTASAFYSLSEFDKEFANKIINAMPKVSSVDVSDNVNMFSIFE